MLSSTGETLCGSRKASLPTFVMSEVKPEAPCNLGQDTKRGMRYSLRFCKISVLQIFVMTSYIDDKILDDDICLDGCKGLNSPSGEEENRMRNPQMVKADELGYGACNRCCNKVCFFLRF